MTIKRGARSTVVAGVLCLLAAAASAQGPHRPPAGRNAEGGGPQRMMPVQRSEQMPAQDASTPGGGGRLSPEERRQLRRDVHEAGRDLYSDRMPPARRESRRQ